MKKNNWVTENPEQSRKISTKFWKGLSQTAYPLSKGTMTVPISLEPFTFSNKQNKDLQKKVSLVISAAKKLTKEYYINTDLQDLVAIDPTEEKLIKASQNQPLVGIIRVDLFYSKNPKIVEINADFPDGLFMHDTTSEHLKKINKQKINFSTNIKSFLELLKKQNVKKTDHLFIGHNKDRSFLDEFELTKIKLKKAGYKNLHMGAFEDLLFKDNYFYFDNHKIDVIRRGSELSKLRNIPGFLDNLIQAQKFTKLKVVNNFKMRLIGHKSLLAAMHDKRFQKLFNKSELSAINSLLPKTLKLDDCKTSIIEKQKDKWVLKPSDLAEGDGITIGSSVTKKEWQEKVRKAMQNSQKWIVQEKIEIPKEKFNIIENIEGKKITVLDAYYDCCPHVILVDDKKINFGNILVRFSESEILNIMKGGGLTYLFQK